MCMHAKLFQLYPTLYNLMDGSLPACSVHGILQTRIIEWVAMRFSGDLPYTGNEPLSPVAPAFQEYSFPMSHQRSPNFTIVPPKKIILETQNGIFDFSLTGILTIICFDNNRNPWIWFWVCSLKECSLILPAF